MSKYKAIVYRKIAAVEKQYNLALHRLDNIVIEADTSHDLARECVLFSRESNDSMTRPDRDLFFIITDRKGDPVAFGSPTRKNVVWDEISFKSMS